MDKFMKKLFYTIPVIFCMLTFASSSEALTTRQKKLLNAAYAIGSEFSHSETLQAILLIESYAGKYRLGDGNTSFGVMQVKLNTAKYILKKYMKSEVVSDNFSVVKLLIENDMACIRVGGSYLKHLYKEFQGEEFRWSKAVLAYNVGPEKVKQYGLAYDPNNYVKRVQSFIFRVVRPYNRKFRKDKLFSFVDNEASVR